MKKLAVWQAINDNLDSFTPVTLLFVLESHGSSPGRQGFLMAITATTMEGSIGGGIMEHKLVEKARKKMQDGGVGPAEIVRQIHHKAAAKNQSGMICSGEQTVVLYAVQQRDKVAVNQIVSSLANLQNGFLHLSATGIFFHTEGVTGKASYQYKNKEEWSYTEPLGCKNHLYIVGGGHCALALSNLACTLDFYIHVFDDRDSLPTVAQNFSAHQKILLDDYSRIVSLIPGGENSYVVIMTFGYRTDDIVVRALQGKRFRYIGLLGSRSKIKKMFDEYRKEGFDENWLQSVHAPVGIHIHSQTPEEIAVSIAAQIIGVKNAAHDGSPDGQGREK